MISALFALAMLPIFAADPSTSPTPADKGAQAAPQPDRDRNGTQISGGQNGIVAAAQANTPVTAKTTKTATPQPTPSQNVTINLIHRLVQRGVLTQEDADELIKQAENDAANARALAAKEKVQPAQAQGPDPSSFSAEPPPLTTSTVTEQQQPPAEAPPEIDSEEDTVHVHYVPDIVKQQLRDEIRQEVMEQAREENWANPRTFPAWVSRITPFADIRLRYDGRFYPSGNDNTGAFPNFNAINTGPPFDVTGTTFSPQLNVDQDRERARIRLRFGAQMDLEDGFTFGLRIGTGETNTPISTEPNAGRGKQRTGRRLQQIRHLARPRVCAIRAGRKTERGFRGGARAIRQSVFHRQ